MTDLVIIGSGGQLGWELVRRSRVEGMCSHPLTSSEIDITDPDSIRSRLEPLRAKVVINAAGYTAVDRAESEPEAAFAANSDGPDHLARVCNKCAAALIHVSTDYVFNGAKMDPYLETDPIDPLGAYGRSKAAGEAKIRGSLERHVILRTSWLCGVHGKNFVKTILELARKREELRVVADQKGCPTFAADLAAAILHIAARIVSGGSVSWGTFHYCSAGTTTWYELAEAVIELARGRETFQAKRLIPITTPEYPTAAKRPANSVLDCSKIARHYAICPRFWKESLAEMIRELYETGGVP